MRAPASNLASAMIFPSSAKNLVNDNLILIDARPCVGVANESFPGVLRFWCCALEDVCQHADGGQDFLSRPRRSSWQGEATRCVACALAYSFSSVMAFVFECAFQYCRSSVFNDSRIATASGLEALLLNIMERDWH